MNAPRLPYQLGFAPSWHGEELPPGATTHSFESSAMPKMAAVAPMDLIKTDPDTASPIPLKCILCPKKPTFSDLSHLLTHIASKSHLAHRFRIELRGHSEEAAQETLEQYEDWYRRYGIRGLLSERLEAKEKKGQPGKRMRLTTSSRQRASSIKFEDAVKIEPDDEHFGHWNATRPSASLHSHGARQDYSPARPSYNLRGLSRGRLSYSGLDSPLDDMLKYEDSPSISGSRDSTVPSSELTEELQDEEEGKSPSAILKGVKWPGMGLFDSASDEQKKKRNQRKDESVLRHMEETSAVVEPTEIIWREIGEFQRSRDIYATPSVEGDPDRELDDPAANEQPKKKKRTRRTAPVTENRQSRRIKRNLRNKNAAAAPDDESVVDGQDNDNEIMPSFSRSRASRERYDVFQDPLEPSPDRSLSSLEEVSFEPRRRLALQPLSSNFAMRGNMNRLSPKPPSEHQATSFFASRESTNTPFSSHTSATSSYLPAPAHHYFSSQNGMGTDTFNPLCVQSRPGFPSYTSFNYSAYSTEAKPSTTSFQPINSLPQAMSGLSYPAYSNPYATESGIRRRQNDYEM